MNRGVNSYILLILEVTKKKITQIISMLKQVKFNRRHRLHKPSIRVSDTAKFERRYQKRRKHSIHTVRNIVAEKYFNLVN